MPPPPPPQEAKQAKAGAEEWKCGWEGDGGQVGDTERTCTGRLAGPAIEVTGLEIAIDQAREQDVVQQDRGTAHTVEGEGESNIG